MANHVQVHVEPTFGRKHHQKHTVKEIKNRYIRQFVLKRVHYSASKPETTTRERFHVILSLAVWNVSPGLVTLVIHSNNDKLINRVIKAICSFHSHCLQGRPICEDTLIRKQQGFQFLQSLFIVFFLQGFLVQSIQLHNK